MELGAGRPGPACVLVVARLAFEQASDSTRESHSSTHCVQEALQRPLYVRSEAKLQKDVAGGEPFSHRSRAWPANRRQAPGTNQTEILRRKSACDLGLFEENT